MSCQFVERLASWCQENCLSLNVSKTKELIVDFRKRQQRPYTPLMISGTPVERVSSFKYLGVNIYKDLTWTAHIQTQVKKARQRLYLGLWRWQIFTTTVVMDQLPPVARCCDIQWVRKVFRPPYIFHSLLYCSHLLKSFKFIFFLINVHTAPHIERKTQNCWHFCRFIKKEKLKYHMVLSIQTLCSVFSRSTLLI